MSSHPTVFIKCSCCSLIAMSTLYVLDWHNRTFGHGKRPYHLDMSTVNVPSGEQGSEIGHIVQVQSKVWTPPLQLHVPPLSTACVQNHCHTFCCMQSDGKNAENEVSLAHVFFFLILGIFQKFSSLIDVFLNQKFIGGTES